MVGGMGVRKNIHIEEWAAYRENCEHFFKFTRASWARLAVFGFAVPIGIYALVTMELLHEDQPHSRGPERLGMRRKYMGFEPKEEKQN